MFFNCPFLNILLIFFSIVAVLLAFYLIYNAVLSGELRELNGKHVIITGGSSGIGKSLAREVARRGGNVTIIARNESKLEEAKREIKNVCVNNIQKIDSFSLDVSDDYEKVKSSILEIEKRNGNVFMLVNCAGTAFCGTLDNLTPTEIKNQFSLNAIGSIFPTKAVIASMKENKGGHIVFVASQGAYLGIYGLSTYCASKFAIRGFAEALKMEVDPFGIKVTVSYPPDTDTPGFAEEEKTKPKETKLISESSGLFSPDAVAQKILKDALEGKFTSNIGLDGFLLEVLCAGMSPINSFFDFFPQIFLMGLFRLIGICYNFSFQRIIKKCHLEKVKVTKSD